jgi:hypothetical protein
MRISTDQETLQRRKSGAPFSIPLAHGGNFNVSESDS